MKKLWIAFSLMFVCLLCMNCREGQIDKGALMEEEMIHAEPAGEVEPLGEVEPAGEVEPKGEVEPIGEVEPAGEVE